MTRRTGPTWAKSCSRRTSTAALARRRKRAEPRAEVFAQRMGAVGGAPCAVDLKIIAGNLFEHFAVVEGDFARRSCSGGATRRRTARAAPARPRAAPGRRRWGRRPRPGSPARSTRDNGDAPGRTGNARGGPTSEPEPTGRRRAASPPPAALRVLRSRSAERSRLSSIPASAATFHSR